MLTKLENISSIQTGHTFRMSVDLLPAGNIKVFQAKDVPGGSLQALRSVAIGKHRYELQDGDVLLSTRGTFRAVAVELNGLRAVAASSVMVIHVTSPNILPEYLAMYLNSPGGQEQLRAAATGVAIKSVTIPELRALSIPVPPVKTQANLALLSANVNAQQTLITTKKKLLNDIINQAAANAGREPRK